MSQNLSSQELKGKECWTENQERLLQRVVVKIPLETSYKGIDPEQYQSFGQCSGGQTVVTH